MRRSRSATLSGVRDVAVLYLLDAGRRRSAYPVAGRVVPVGRDPANGIVLADPTVSRFQFLLCRAGSRYVIQDAGSRYGTFVNGKRLTGPVALRRGSCIGAGGVRMLYWDEPWTLCAGADESKSRSNSSAREGLSPAWRRRSFAFRVWWRMSHRSLAFGWKVRRR